MSEFVRDRLVISKRRMKVLRNCGREEQLRLSVIQVTPSELCSMDVYSTVVSSNYNELIIELDSDFECNFIEGILSICKTIKVRGFGQNNNCAKILCLIYPDKADKIRKAYLLKNSIYDVISEVSNE